MVHYIYIAFHLIFLEETLHSRIEMCDTENLPIISRLIISIIVRQATQFALAAYKI